MTIVRRCPYCGGQPDTGGSGDHMPGCSEAGGNHLQRDDVKNPYGWICPACWRVNAPWLPTCPCWICEDPAPYEPT